MVDVDPVEIGRVKVGEARPSPSSPKIGTFFKKDIDQHQGYSHHGC